MAQGASDSVAALRAEMDLQLKGVRELLDERDKRYTERDVARGEAVAAALTAEKEQTKATFAASEKAIQKEQENSEKWRANANEWRDAMTDREQKFASRSESEAEFRSVRALIGALHTEIASLRESRAASTATHDGGQAVKDESRTNLALLLSIVTAAATAVVYLSK